MNYTRGTLIMITVMLTVGLISGCSNDDILKDSGEESSTELTLNETYDNVRNGARLILAYDAQSNSFKGTVENTTDETLQQVRVEVHLSNGTELGPTTPVDLQPGSKGEVELTATSKDFDRWTAHLKWEVANMVATKRAVSMIENAGRECHLTSIN